MSVPSTQSPAPQFDFAMDVMIPISSTARLDDGARDADRRRAEVAVGQPGNA